jgi:NAD(P)-dependent dehydrogenase (short-subunit alcohol dehydrogenase family)
MDKKIVIIGASSGIGFGLASKLSATYKVYAYARTPGKLEGLPNVVYRTLDVTENDLALGELPELIDGLVYCPGTINLKPFRRLTEDDFLNDFSVNLTGAIKVIQKLYSRLRKSEHASIVMFSTIAVSVGMNFHSSIAASKGAVEGLVKSLAAEFAPRIRVNAIAPSLTDTPLAASLLSTDAKKEISSKMHPLQRIGNIDDHVNATLFLLGQQSSWMTGQILRVYGGMSSIKS